MSLPIHAQYVSLAKSSRHQRKIEIHYNHVIMGAMASQITSLTIVYSTVYSDTYQRKHQSSASLAFEWGIHRWPVNSPHKWPVTRRMFPFDDVIMIHPVFVIRVVWVLTHWSLALSYRYVFVYCIIIAPRNVLVPVRCQSHEPLLIYCQLGIPSGKYSNETLKKVQNCSIKSFSKYWLQSSSRFFQPHYVEKDIPSS